MLHPIDRQHAPGAHRKGRRQGAALGLDDSPVAAVDAVAGRDHLDGEAGQEPGRDIDDAHPSARDRHAPKAEVRRLVVVAVEPGRVRGRELDLVAAGVGRSGRGPHGPAVVDGHALVAWAEAQRLAGDGHDLGVARHHGHVVHGHHAELRVADRELPDEGEVRQGELAHRPGPVERDVEEGAVVGHREPVGLTADEHRGAELSGLGVDDGDAVAADAGPRRHARVDHSAGRVGDEVVDRQVDLHVRDRDRFGEHGCGAAGEHGGDRQARGEHDGEPGAVRGETEAHGGKAAYGLGGGRSGPKVTMRSVAATGP